MRNKLLVLIACVFLLSIGACLYIQNESESQKENNNTLTNTIDEEESYVNAMKNIFQEYSKGSTKSITSTALEGLGNENSGIQSRPKEYYTNTFEVLNIKNGLAGGKEMNIVFEKHPKEIFWVWIYKLADGTYQIKGFQLNTLTDNNK